jgi:CBS domain-containing protein
MKCRDVMKVAVYRCRSDECVDSCARAMRDNNIGFVPIVDAFDRLIGVVTDRDLAVRLVANDLPPSTPVEQVMTREPLVVFDPEEDVRTAEVQLASSRKSRAVVVDRQQRCLGVISLSDIAQEAPPEEVGRLLKNVTRREAVHIFRNEHKAGWMLAWNCASPRTRRLPVT